MPRPNGVSSAAMTKRGGGAPTDFSAADVTNNNIFAARAFVASARGGDICAGMRGLANHGEFLYDYL